MITYMHLLGLPGVFRVMKNSLHSLQTTRSWDYLGLSIESPSNLLNKANMGDGIIIGLLDTGLLLFLIKLYAYVDDCNK